GCQLRTLLNPINSSTSSNDCIRRVLCPLSIVGELCGSEYSMEYQVLNSGSPADLFVVIDRFSNSRADNLWNRRPGDGPTRSADCRGGGIDPSRCYRNRNKGHHRLRR